MTESTQPETATHDVYAFGMIASSTLYRIRGEFPLAEGYAEIDGIDHMTGGEAANSAVVLARLGVRVRLDGNHIGDDPGGERTRSLLSGYGVDTARLTPVPGYRGVEEVVVAAAATRTIFGTYVQLQDDRAWNDPDEEDITRARVVCLDPFFGAASYRAAEIGFAAGIPVVTVDCPLGDRLLERVSAVVIAESYLRENHADRRPEAVFADYRESVAGLVIFTFGDRSIWYARPGEPVRQFEPYPVAAVDTTGAGDSFRAGVVFGYLSGWEDEQIIRFSAALAAIVCTRSPGVFESPACDEVLDFMASGAS